LFHSVSSFSLRYLYSTKQNERASLEKTKELRKKKEGLPANQTGSLLLCLLKRKRFLGPTVPFLDPKAQKRLPHFPAGSPSH